MCDNLQAEGEVICCISIRDFTVCPTRGTNTSESGEVELCICYSLRSPGAFFSWYEHIYHCTGWILGYKNTYLLPSLAFISKILSCTIHSLFKGTLTYAVLLAALTLESSSHIRYNSTVLHTAPLTYVQDASVFTGLIVTRRKYFLIFTNLTLEIFCKTRYSYEKFVNNAFVNTLYTR